MPVLHAATMPHPLFHGFTTRDPEVMEVVTAAGGERFYRAHQVHGTAVIVVRGDEDPQAIREQEADILCTNAPGVAVGVVTADCVPVLLGAPAHRLCAVVHAGWRGTAARAPAVAVTALARLGAPPESLFAALGPAICGACYEVGEEVATAIAAVDATAVSRAPGASHHADLRQANRTALVRAGVAPDRISDLGACTHCDPAQRFASYRRDGVRRGEQLSFIGCLP